MSLFLGTPSTGLPVGSERLRGLREKPGCLRAQKWAGHPSTNLLVREWVGGAQGKRELIEVVMNKGLLSTAYNRREKHPS